MKKLLAAAVLFGTAALAVAQPPRIPLADDVRGAAPPVDKEVKVPVGRPYSFKLPAKTTGYEPAFDTSKCRVARLWSDDPEVMELEVWPFEDGEFWIVFWTVSEKRGTATKIVAGKGVPVPGPVVPPGPLPRPPAPKVVPPADLVKNITAAYEADGGEPNVKAEAKRNLRIFYDTVVDTRIVFDPDITTGNQLLVRMKNASDGMVKGDVLYNTRYAVAEWLGRAVRKADTLNDAQRTDIDQHCKDIAAALRD